MQKQEIIAVMKGVMLIVAAFSTWAVCWGFVVLHTLVVWFVECLIIGGK